MCFVGGLLSICGYKTKDTASKEIRLCGHIKYQIAKTEHKIFFKSCVWFFNFLETQISILPTTIKTLNRGNQSWEQDGKEKLPIVLLLMNYLDSSRFMYSFNNA